MHILLHDQVLSCKGNVVDSLLSSLVHIPMPLVNIGPMFSDPSAHIQRLILPFLTGFFPDKSAFSGLPVLVILKPFWDECQAIYLFLEEYPDEQLVHNSRVPAVIRNQLPPAMIPTSQPLNDFGFPANRVLA
ncbi:hypothetical protein Ac2012v2_004857 [Leucoagaricus gongylophorus]